MWAVELTDPLHRRGRPLHARPQGREWHRLQRRVQRLQAGRRGR